MKGDLAEQWEAKFKEELPLFFDTAGAWFVEHQGREPLGYGLYETLAGIVLYQSTGYLPLSSSYDFRFSVSAKQITEGRRVAADEEEKLRIVETLFSEKELDVIRDHSEGLTQPPDLLMYAPGCSDWFFCEAKGPTDRLSEGQVRKFTQIAEATRKPVRVFGFEELSSTS
jgi:hypothetical protein